jgi:hypothetical protein
MTNRLKYMLEDGLVKKIKTLSISSDLYSVPGNPQSSGSLAPCELLKKSSIWYAKGLHTQPSTSGYEYLASKAGDNNGYESTASGVA